MRAVPFIVGEEPNNPFAVRGRVSFGGASLTLELETSPEVGDPSALRKVVIGVEEFVTCKFKRGLRSDRLDLKAFSLSALGGVPGAFQDAMTLRFAKCDRGGAEALAGRLSHRLARS